jgi:hypothetical protein
MSETRVRDDDNREGEVEEFFGQLWWVPSSATSTPRVHNPPSSGFIRISRSQDRSKRRIASLFKLETHFGRIQNLVSS